MRSSGLTLIVTIAPFLLPSVATANYAAWRPVWRGCARARACARAYAYACAWASAGRRRPGGQVTCPAEHLIEHCLGHPAGERVLLTGVVAAQHRQRPGHRARQRDLRSVAERRPRPGSLDALGRQARPERLPGEVAEADDHPQLRQQHG